VKIECWGLEIAQSELPWNAWVSDTPPSFLAGGWWAAMEHLRDCKQCRRTNNLTLKEIRRELKRLEKGWRQLVD
jgi:hypothetical protein